jgi:N-acetylglucosamine kinase-like BadF-type ATPase
LSNPDFFQRGPVVAGFDCGGTHTTCALAGSGGEVFAVGQAGPGNVCTHPDTAPGEFRKALDEALRRSGVSVASVRAACVGAAGYFACNVPGGPDAALAGLFPPQASSEIVSDIEIAFSGAALGGDAVVLIAGTGSVAYGGTKAGSRARAGGWGYLLSDEGSAFWIGLQGVRAALRAYDGRGPETKVTGELLDALRLDDPADLEGAVYGMASVNTGVASLASAVLKAAREGDEAAARIAAEGGRLLADAVLAVLRRLDLLEAPIPVATVGGVLQDPDSPVRHALIRSLERDAPLAQVVWPALPPVGGAVVRALSLAGFPPDSERCRRIGESLSERLSA